MTMVIRSEFIFFFICVIIIFCIKAVSTKNNFIIIIKLSTMSSYVKYNIVENFIYLFLIFSYLH